MSVRFTPGLDDLVHPVRDAKLLAQFWPFFFALRISPRFYEGSQPPGRYWGSTSARRRRPPKARTARRAEFLAQPTTPYPATPTIYTRHSISFKMNQSHKPVQIFEHFLLLPPRNAQKRPSSSAASSTRSPPVTNPAICSHALYA